MRVKTQDPKYDIEIDPTNLEGARLVNSTSGKPIDADVPVFMLLAKDKKALSCLLSYYASCENVEHCKAVWLRFVEFNDFQRNNPGRMKEPDTGPLTPSGASQISNHKLEMLQVMLDVLNEAVAADAAAVSELVDHRVACNEQLAKHPAIQVGASGEGDTINFEVGMLGVINGICERATGRKIAALINDDTMKVESFFDFTGYELAKIHNHTGTIVAIATKT